MQIESRIMTEVSELRPEDMFVVYQLVNSLRQSKSLKAINANGSLAASEKVLEILGQINTALSDDIILGREERI